MAPTRAQSAQVNRVLSGAHHQHLLTNGADVTTADRRDEG